MSVKFVKFIELKSEGYGVYELETLSSNDLSGEDSPSFAVN